MISDQELLAYNQEGIIPGPDETEEQFLKRAPLCLRLRQELSKYSEMPSSFVQLEADLTQTILQPAFVETRDLFDIAPDWIPILFGNDQMPFWHGGCAWIFQMHDDSPVAALLQLRKTFLHSARYLGIYDRTEIIAHELSHVGRMVFQEPRFEEVIAYRTSASPLRRWLGPIVESSKESVWFVLILGVIVMADIALIATGQEVAYLWAMWLKVIPLALIGFGLWRLSKKQRQYDRCLDNLMQIYPNRHQAQAVLYRLTDQEIVLFSGLSPEAIREHLHTHKTASLRWRLITTAYHSR